MLNLLPWDSDFFQLRVAEARIEVLNEKAVADIASGAEDEAIDVVYVFSESETQPERTPNLPGWMHVDTKVTFRKALAREPVTEARTEVSDYTQSEYDYPALLKLALAAGEHSRFRVDPRFGQERFKALYERWLDRSLDGSFADYVLVTRDEQGKPTGFVTGRLRDTSIHVGLIAVSSEARGQGLGRALLGELVTRAQGEYGVTELRIPTQADNVGAMAFYEAYGMTEGPREWVWHYWRG